MRVLIFSLFFIFSVVLNGWAQNHIGTIKDLNGNVRIERDGEFLKPVVGLELFTGDLIKTRKDASVGIILLDGTRISLGAFSELTLTSFIFQPWDKKYAFDVFLKKGTATYSSGKLSKLAPEKIQFRTPKTVVGVRGTKFLIEVQ